MTLQQAIEILEQHQKWRRESSVPPQNEMQNPTELGIAIDLILKHVKDERKI